MDLLQYPFDSSLILRKKKSIKRELLKKDHLLEKKIAILSGSTIGEVKEILELFLLDNGIKPIFFEGQYGKYYEEVLYDNKQLYEFNPDMIYIHTSNKNIEYHPDLCDSQSEISQKIEKVYDKFYSMWEKIKRELGCIIIQNNFEYSRYRVMGNKDSMEEHGFNYFIKKLNDRFADYSTQNKNFYINDIHYLSAYYGVERWSNTSTWYLYKYFMDIEAIPMLCHNISHIIKAIYGKNKKTIILDLDNTLWGGVIGEVGKEGIELGKETPRGMAFADFQSYLKALSEMGVILNICSKNEEENAKAGFEHPSSILKADDFICFKANWLDKHVNIQQIIEEINIMEDSVIFIDDNLAEREIVAQNLPSIVNLKIDKVEDYISVLDQSGFFEVTQLSKDDIKRNDFYKDNIKRGQLEKSFTNFEDYLRSLEMKYEIKSFDKKTLERVVQLINKTNQFNLTTRRYTGAEIDEIAFSSKYITLYGRLADKFGDNGIVTVLIGKIEGDTVSIDLWVMSCRVFKRHLEYAMFDKLVKVCKEKHLQKIRGFYYRTAKNNLVSSFYGELGFGKVKEDEYSSIWEYEVPPSYNNMNSVMEEIRDDSSRS